MSASPEIRHVKIAPQNTCQIFFYLVLIYTYILTNVTVSATAFVRNFGERLDTRQGRALKIFDFLLARGARTLAVVYSGVSQIARCLEQAKM